MEWDEVLALLKAVMLAEWTETSVAWQNEDFPQVYGASWLYAELLPIDASLSDFNSEGLRVASGTGLIALHVFVPTGTGASDAFRLAKLAGRLLRNRTLSTGVTTGAASTAGAGSGDDEGNWFRVSCSLPVFINATV